ncbi:thiamine ABC transporter substrate-binding protein [Alphaproteobacteria bacterium]|nr:thiamine ABC transporter substrate-binding protein [Alphaproteobacteria bacterium]
MNFKLLTIILFLPIQVLAKEELKILTYGSFNSDWGPGPNIEKEFESVCNCNLIWNTAESSGALLSRMKLTKNNEGYDVLLGLDDSLIKEAEGNDLFLEHKIKEFNLDLDWNNKFFTPFDYGYFSFIYDQTKLSTPPQSFDELASRNDISIIVMDPRYSTPGLGLAKWIDQVYQEGAAEFWKNLQDQIVITSKSWSDGYGLFLEGESDVVLSYTTSPAYHSLIEGNSNYQSLNMIEGHAIQIEVMGILKNASNYELARNFLEFSLSENFQKHIPQGNWMYPVIDLQNSQNDFYSAAPKPKPLDQIFPSLPEKESWILNWKLSLNE